MATRPIGRTPRSQQADHLGHHFPLRGSKGPDRLPAQTPPVDSEAGLKSGEWSDGVSSTPRQPGPAFREPERAWTVVTNLVARPCGTDADPLVKVSGVVAITECGTRIRAEACEAAASDHATPHRLGRGGRLARQR